MSKGKKGGDDAALPQYNPFDPSYMVRIVTRDEASFIVDRNCAKVSKLFRAALAGTPVDPTDGIAFDPVPPTPPPALTPPQAGEASAPTPAAKGPASLPTIHVAFLDAAQMGLALKFMYHKYKVDSELVAPTAAPPALMPAAVAASPPTELLCIAALLQC